MLERGTLLLMDLDAEGRARAAHLMRKYRDTPMSLADSSLVVMAERLQLQTIFTLDRDFEVYRIDGRRPFSLLP